MRKMILAACGVAALGLMVSVGGASAASLSGGAAALSGAAQAQAAPEDVRWRRVCRQVRVWRHGRSFWTTQCRNVWVGPTRRPGWCGPGMRCW